MRRTRQTETKLRRGSLLAGEPVADPGHDDDEQHDSTQYRQPAAGVHVPVGPEGHADVDNGRDEDEDGPEGDTRLDNGLLLDIHARGFRWAVEKRFDRRPGLDRPSLLGGSEPYNRVDAPENTNRVREPRCPPETSRKSGLHRTSTT